MRVAPLNKNINYRKTNHTSNYPDIKSKHNFKKNTYKSTQQQQQQIYYQTKQLQTQRQKLLAERKQHQKNNTFQQPKSIPQISFKKQKKIQKQHPFSKINLIPVVDKMIQKSINQNQQFQSGLINIKLAQQKIIKQLQRQHSQRTQSNYDNEQIDYQKNKKQNLAQKMIQLKKLIQRIIHDCRTDHGDIRNSLQNMKYQHNKIWNQIHRDQISSSYHSNNQQQQNYQIEDQKRSRVSSKGSNQNSYSIKSSKAESSINIMDNIEGLNDIQAKVFKEILGLRQEKLRLMKQLNDEIKKSNSITRQYKRLQKQFIKIKQKKNDSDYETNTVIVHKKKNNEYQYNQMQKNRRIEQNTARQQIFENQKLQQKIIRQEEVIKKLNNELNKLNNENNKFSKQTRHNQNQNKNEVGSSRKKYSNNRRNEQQQSDYKLLQQQLKKLKIENEELRIESIKLLRLKNNIVQKQQNNDNREQIQRLRKQLSRANEQKKQIINQLELYKRKSNPYQMRYVQSEIQHLTSKNSIPNNNYKLNIIQQYQKNKSYNHLPAFQNYQKNNNYYLNKQHTQKRQSQIGRLQQYRELLSGLKNVKTDHLNYY